MKLSLIAAMAQNGVIGRGNQLPWRLPADLKHFKTVTMGKPVIMGRKTWESIGRPLPGRTNIVVTRNPYFLASNCLVAHSIEEALEIAHDNGEEEVFILGGGEIYAQSMPYWDRLYITEIDLETEGDVFFPEWDESEWRERRREAHPPDEKNPYPYTFRVLERLPAKDHGQPVKS